MVGRVVGAGVGAAHSPSTANEDENTKGDRARCGVHPVQLSVAEPASTRAWQSRTFELLRPKKGDTFQGDTLGRSALEK